INTEIGFNYLGQFNEDKNNESLFTTADVLSDNQDQNLPRIHLLDVIGLVADGKLQVSWMYSSEQYKHSTINQVAVSFKQYLNQLLAMQPDKNHMYIPSDFPLCQLTQNDLNVLISDRTDVESIYPLSPLQKGMLFHTYLS